MDSVATKDRPIVLMHTKSVWGGAQKYVYDLALALQNQGEPVLVAAGGNGELAARLDKKGIPYHTLCSSSRDVAILSEYRLLKELWIFFRDKNPRIVHVNGSKLGTLGSIIAKLALGSRVRVIYSTHGLPTFEPRPKLQRLLIWASLQLASFFQNHIIAISKLDYEGVKKQLFFVKKKTFYIPISIDTASYNFLGREEVRDKIAEDVKFQITEKTLIIGTIAERTRNKALRVLVAAAKQIDKKNVIFVLYGWGEETQNLQSLIASLSLKNIFLLPGENASLSLKGLDIFVLPSVKEGLPYTLLEAGLAGLPLIGTHVGGIPEVVKHKKTGLLVTPNNPGHITHALRKLIENDSLRKTFGENAQNLVMKNFTIENMVTQTFTLYSISASRKAPENQ